jgi:hypothetical protein
MSASTFRGGLPCASNKAAAAHDTIKGKAVLQHTYGGAAGRGIAPTQSLRHTRRA